RRGKRVPGRSIAVACGDANEGRVEAPVRGSGYECSPDALEALNAVQLKPGSLKDALDACRSRNTTDDALVALPSVAVLADRAIAADLREGAIAVNERIIGCVVCEDIPSRTVDSALNVIG